MRLTQPLKLWQLTFFASLAFSPLVATASWHPSASVRRQPLELEQFPRDVVLVGELPADMSELAFARSADGAASAWSDVGCSAAKLRWRGRETSVPAYEEATSVLFVDPDAERCFIRPDDIAWTLQQPCCSTGDGPGECSGTLYPPQTILLNRDRFRWLTTPDPYGPPPDAEKLTVDVQSVLTHELGHVLDLRHEESDPLATMAPRYLRDGGLSSLAAADRAALCERWPNGTKDCDSDADCDPFGGCVEVGEFMVCEEERATVGQYCDLGQLTCSDECYVTSSAAYTGYCTALCASDADCPDDMFCDSESEACRLTATARPTGCSAAKADPPGAIVLLLGFVALFSRRRSR